MQIFIFLILLSMTNKNRGMFLETIINKSISFFWENNLAFIEKKGLPITFASVKKQNNKFILENSIISRKNTVDYIGMLNGKFICFEAKTSNEDKFILKNIKQHQLEYLILMQSHGAIAFFVFYFSKQNEFYKVDPMYIDSELKKNKKSLHFEELKENSIKIELNFPGVLNLL